MKKFRFPLQAVLNLKKLREEEAQRRLGEELRAANQLRDRKEEAENLKAAFDQAFYQIPRTGSLDTVGFRRHLNHQAVLAADIRHTGHALMQQEQEVDAARGKLKDARCQTQIHEKIREHRLKAYQVEATREETKDMNEIALLRHRRERGAVAPVIVLIGATVILLSLLFVAVLAVGGKIDGHKLGLITKILAYKGAEAEKQMLLVGENDPYLISNADFLALKAIEAVYNRKLVEEPDDRNILTDEVLAKRREIISRVQKTLTDTHGDIAKKLDGIAAREQELEKKTKLFEEEKKAWEATRRKDSKETADKAQEDIMRTFKTMDAEVVSGILTGGKTFEEYKLRVAERNQAVAYIAGYVTKMSPRQRAAVMEALGPAWAMAVNNFLEQTPAP